MAAPFSEHFLHPQAPHKGNAIKVGAILLGCLALTALGCSSSTPSTPAPTTTPTPNPSSVWPNIPTGALRWVGFVAPLDAREVPLPVEIMNAQGGFGAGFYLVDSLNHVVALELFAVSAIGQLNAINQREITVDVHVQNFANKCTFNASGVFLVNDFPDNFLEGFGSGFEIPPAGGPLAPGTPGPPPVTIRNYQKKFTVPNNATVKVRPTGYTSPTNTLLAMASTCS